MIAYRVLAHNVQKHIGITFEAALASIAFSVKALAHELSTDEAAIFRASLPLELRQLVGRAQPSGTHDAQQLLELLSAQFNLSLPDAAKRIVTLIDELKGGVSPWDDVAFIEVLDDMRARVSSVVGEGVAA